MLYDSNSIIIITIIVVIMIIIIMEPNSIQQSYQMDQLVKLNSCAKK